MKPILILVAVAALLSLACGGDDGDVNVGDIAGGDSVDVVISPADADRVAHAGLPAIADLPGDGWTIIAEDQFDSGQNNSLEFIQGNPECETLENLAALEDIFGGGEEDDTPPAGQAQVEFEQQGGDALIPTSVEVSIEVAESAASSRAEFAIVKALFESDDTSDCLISVLNTQFAESGPGGLEIEVKEGSGTEDAPQDGASLAFDIDMSFAGIELPLAMQLYFWPYGNANVQALFLGTRETLTGDLVEGVLEAVDEKLKAATGGE